jgi:hypothetical protein
MNHPAMSSRHVTSAQCSHLRHKGMYVLPDQTQDADAYQEHLGSSSFWCLCTQKAFGPDGAPVSPENCCAGRVCCEH